MNRLTTWLSVGLCGAALGALGGAQWHFPGAAMAGPIPQASTHAAGAVLRTSFLQDTTLAPEVVALGQKIFVGKAAGGLCFTCHGSNAKGVKGLGPNLTDGTWLHGDGSYSGIVAAIEKGVPKPRESGTPMPAKGGAKLSSDQLRAVAAYVYSLRTKK